MSFSQASFSSKCENPDYQSQPRQAVHCSHQSKQKEWTRVRQLYSGFEWLHIWIVMDEHLVLHKVCMYPRSSAEPLYRFLLNYECAGLTRMQVSWCGLVLCSHINKVNNLISCILINSSYKGSLKVLICLDSIFWGIKFCNFFSVQIGSIIHFFPRKFATSQGISVFFSLQLTTKSQGIFECFSCKFTLLLSENIYIFLLNLPL